MLCFALDTLLMRRCCFGFMTRCFASYRCDVVTVDAGQPVKNFFVIVSNNMKMSKKSKAIRICLLPIWILIWFVGGIGLGLAYFFEAIWSGMDKVRDKFEEWVNNIAPVEHE